MLKRTATIVVDLGFGNPDLPSPDLVNTTNWGYLRLRRESYTDQSLRDWIKKLRSQAWDEAYVFFKHEDTATGPKLAATRSFSRFATQPLSPGARRLTNSLLAIWNPTAPGTNSDAFT